MSALWTILVRVAAEPHVRLLQLERSYHADVGVRVPLEGGGPFADPDGWQREDPVDAAIEHAVLDMMRKAHMRFSPGSGGLV